MVVSTTTRNIFSTLGYEAGTEFIKECGFDAMDMGLMRQTAEKEEFSEENYEKTCKMLLREAEKNGLYFNQAHSPYPAVTMVDRDQETVEEYNQKIWPHVVRSIKIAGILGAKQVVVHPVDCTSVPEINQKEFNLEFFNSLIPYCKEYNVKIALENMWRNSKELGRRTANVCSFGRDLADYVDALDERYFTVCLDLGHSSIVGQLPEEAIRELGGKRLTALHVHDNNTLEDLHTIPFMGKTNWSEVMKALADIDYQGDLTFEVLTDKFPVIRKSAEMTKNYYKLLASTGKELVKMFENHKKEM